ncbi:MAG: efflux RND transporter permease subunit, partial [Pseudomonadota bacterium]
MTQTTGTPEITSPTGGLIGVFIRRPILAAVLSLLIVLAGLAAMNAIEVRELPEVDQPVISIR